MIFNFIVIFLFFFSINERYNGFYEGLDILFEEC